MRSRGFTLIELLVVIVIIGILVAIALPNFIKVKDKAKEAETKQNLHSIQLAVERYATDMEGNYPFFLYGGDARYNIGTAAGILNANYWDWMPYIDEPFDQFWCSTGNWDYNMCGSYNDLSKADLPQAFGDTVAFEGYMPKYPSNPFVEGKARIQFSTDYWNAGNMWVRGTALWGGEDGVKMFNLAPWGDLPLIHKAWGNLAGDKPLLDFPGQFIYHPRWTDGVTNWGHGKRQEGANGGGHGNDYGGYRQAPPLNDQNDVSSLDVAAYDLLATGATRTKGQDLDNDNPQEQRNQYYFAQHRTGYLTLGQERNPWIQAGTYTNSQNYGERPYSDSIPDFYIIHLSSGIDKKIQDELQKN